MSQVPDVNSLISSRTSSKVYQLRNDSRFISMHGYLQSYAELATLGRDYPDHMVDRLFNLSSRLADKAKSILKWEPNIGSYDMNDAADKAKYKKDMRTLEVKRHMEDSFLHAYTRADKVLAIDALVHLEHVSGALLPELFGFGMMHEPTLAYTSEILEKLAGGSK